MTKRWIDFSGDGEFISGKKPVVSKCLEAGAYDIEYFHKIDRHGLVKKERILDEIIELPDESADTVVRNFRDFWDREDLFREFGFIHKRGILMYGPPGAGKTTAITRAVSHIVNELDGIALWGNTDARITKQIIAMIRSVEPQRPLVVILEDFDGIGGGNLTSWLGILDGDGEIDSIMFLVTTNYLERLEPRITVRPSRFDVVLEVGMPGRPARLEYFKHKLPESHQEYAEVFARETSGFSIAHLKEVILGVLVFGEPLDEVVERLRKMLEAPDQPKTRLEQALEGLRADGNSEEPPAWKAPRNEEADASNPVAAVAGE